MKAQPHPQSPSGTNAPAAEATPIMHSERARNEAVTLLHDVLLQQLDLQQRTWFVEQSAILQTDQDDRRLYTTFSAISRRLGKADLALADQERTAFARCLQGWQPRSWSRADTGRILLLARLPGSNPGFAARFRALCQTADVGEAISLFRGLPLYPAAATLESQVAEGLRTNMRAVFEAIAHHNSYPRSHFDPHRWNHMVLKALFVGSSLAPIDGVDERANPELARILIDFAHERWAAGRPVPLELWRCVGPFVQGPALAILQRVLASSDLRERQAAALALAACPDPEAVTLLNQQPEIRAAIAAGELSWADFNTCN